MDAQTAVLIQNLADRLGTTSEYLWAVLIKQAPITGAVNLICYALTVLAFVIAWKFRGPILAGIEKLIDTHSDAVSFVSFMGALFFSVLALVWLGAMVFSIQDTVTAFLNPEYFALDKVLNAVKSK